MQDEREKRKQRTKTKTRKEKKIDKETVRARALAEETYRKDEAPRASTLMLSIEVIFSFTSAMRQQRLPEGFIKRKYSITLIILH